MNKRMVLWKVLKYTLVLLAVFIIGLYRVNHFSSNAGTKEIESMKRELDARNKEINRISIEYDTKIKQRDEKLNDLQSIINALETEDTIINAENTETFRDLIDCKKKYNELLDNCSNVRLNVLNSRQIILAASSELVKIDTEIIGNRNDIIVEYQKKCVTLNALAETYREKYNLQRKKVVSNYITAFTMAAAACLVSKEKFVPAASIIAVRFAVKFTIKI